MRSSAAGLQLQKDARELGGETEADGKTIQTGARRGLGVLLLHRRGEVLSAQGDPADAVFFYIRKGRVKLTVYPSGKEPTVARSHG